MVNDNYMKIGDRGNRFGENEIDYTAEELF